MLLYISYFLHNFVAWLKIRPFLERRGSLIYVGSLVLVQPYWIAALWTNFELFNGNGNYYFRRLRPVETFARDPWWIFVTGYLFWVLKTRFDRGVFELIRMSPRFGIMITCMLLSIAFLIADVSSVFADLVHTGGGNPYWRFALIFKCASDTIFLDDFKRVFDVLGVNASQRSTDKTLVSGNSNPERGSDVPLQASGTRENLCEKCSCNTSAQKVKDLERGESVDVEEAPRRSLFLEEKNGKGDEQKCDEGRGSLTSQP
jgi:hypothetical protein